MIILLFLMKLLSICLKNLDRLKESGTFRGFSMRGQGVIKNMFVVRDRYKLKR